MTNAENVRQLLDQLKTCPCADISNYFAPLTDLIRFLSKAEKAECAGSFYQWAKENAGNEPVKFSYAEFLLALTHFTSEEHEDALHLLTKARKQFEEQNESDGQGLCAMLIGATYRTLGNFE